MDPENGIRWLVCLGLCQFVVVLMSSSKIDGSEEKY
jgi:hypothetical protein